MLLQSLKSNTFLGHLKRLIQHAPCHLRCLCSCFVSFFYLQKRNRHPGMIKDSTTRLTATRKVSSSSPLEGRVQDSPRRAGGGAFLRPLPQVFRRYLKKRWRAAPQFLAQLILHLFRIGWRDVSSMPSKVRSISQVKGTCSPLTWGFKLR